jgi:hypothetical protein
VIDIEYAIPSRARAETLIAKTLPLLLRLGIEREAIRVFVADEEVEPYWQAVYAPDSPFRGVQISPGAVGMCAQRNAIHAHYGEGARFITIDDDIRDLMIRANEKQLVPVTADEWEDIVDQGFGLCARLGARVWGLYPVPNAYFMKPRVRTDLCYIGGGLWGCVNRIADGTLHSELEYRDDWERSVKCYAADGALVRFDYVTWKTSGYQGAGGMQTDGDRTYEATLRDCEELVCRYPDLVTLNLTKKSGWPETRLRDRRPLMRDGQIRSNA